MGQPKNQHISYGLNQAVRQLGLEQRLKQMRVMEEWAELVGESISQISKPDHIRDGILYVRVTSMAWRTELGFHKQTILEKIAEKLDKKLIKDIRFI